MAEQLRRLKWLLLVLYAPVLTLMAGIAWLGDDWARYLLRDAHSLAELPFFAGIVSNIGVLCWTVALAVCFFSGALIRRKHAERDVGRFFYAAGALTTLLMLDDFFLLHEDLFRYYLPLPEWLVFGAYAALAVVFLLRYRRVILATEYLLLLLAVALLGLSVAVDVAQQLITPEQFRNIGGYVLEDGYKFAGIVAWTAYFVRTGYAQCMAAWAPRPAPEQRVTSE